MKVQPVQLDYPAIHFSLSAGGDQEGETLMYRSSIPAGATFDASQSSPTCQVEGNEVACAVAQAGGTSGEVAITFSVDSGLPSSSLLDFSFSLEGSLPDPLPENNEVSISMALSAQPFSLYLPAVVR